MSRPGTEAAPPGGVCHKCTDGALKVKVYLQTVCWDTDLTLGVRSPDRPFNGVEVSISGPTSQPPKPTAGNGEVTFSGLTPGSYSVSVQKTGFTDETTTIPSPPPDITADMLTGPHQVTERATADAVRIMRRNGLRCHRKHSAKTGGAPGTRRIVLPILWLGNDEPWVMILRDTLWLAALVTMAIALATGNLALGAWCAAFAAYLTTVIFGQGAGVPVMTVAFAGYVAMLAVSILALTMGFGLPKPNPLWLGAASAIWIGFGWALARGRRPEYFNSKPLEIIIAGILGTVMALMLFFMAGGSLGSPQGFWATAGAVMVVVLIAAVGFASGALGGLFSHTFTNEGKVENPRWHTQTDYLLPFVGEHYCVQGLRGFISHTFDPGDQEYAQDWEFPLGTPILASKEGHIVWTKEDEDGAKGMSVLGLFRILGDGNETPNEIHVEHRDESVAEYLHLRKGGITEINSLIPAAVKAQPLHVHAGHRIAAAGNVGISMFSHLHFMVKYKPGTAARGELSARRPVKFQDGDTASHGNRCFSMRKYASSNVDRGMAVAPDDDPPFKPGGAPTDGTPPP